MRFFKNVDVQAVIVLFLLTSLLLIVPQYVWAAVNVEQSVKTLGETVQKIGLSVVVVCLIIGGVMMASGSQRGPQMISSSVIGGVVVLAAGGIVSLIENAVN